MLHNLPTRLSAIQFYHIAPIWRNLWVNEPVQNCSKRWPFLKECIQIGEVRLDDYLRAITGIPSCNTCYLDESGWIWHRLTARFVFETDRNVLTDDLAGLDTSGWLYSVFTTLPDDEGIELPNWFTAWKIKESFFNSKGLFEIVSLAKYATRFNGQPIYKQE